MSTSTPSSTPRSQPVVVDAPVRAPASVAVPAPLTTVAGRAEDTRLEVLQVGRFVAAALVVIAHAYSRLMRTVPEAATHTVLFGSETRSSWGHLGVDFFFVLSGFIMAWTNWNRFARPSYPGEFLARRIARVVPMYWIATTVALVLLLSQPALFSHGQRPVVSWILKSYFFVPALSPGGYELSPLVGLGWTLNFEMYFYLLFAFALVLSRRHALLALLGFLAASVAFGLAVPPVGAPMLEVTSWLLLEFALGVGLAVALRLQRALSREAAWTILVLGTIELFATMHVIPQEIDTFGIHFGRFLLWGIPVAAVLYALLSLPSTWVRSLPGRTMARWGDAGYSIYLFQVFCLPAIALVMRRLHLERVLHIDVLVLLLAAGSIAVSIAIYHAIEAPLTRTSTALISRHLGRTRS